MTIDNLINFIDRYTNDDAIYPNKSCDKGIKIEEKGFAFIRSFSNRDWLTLRTDFDLKERSSFWIKCLIHLLDGAYTEQARQMIIYIALNGTEKNFLDAMEYIHNFRRDVSTYTWLKLKNRSAEILKSRSNH